MKSLSRLEPTVYTLSGDSSVTFNLVPLTAAQRLDVLSDITDSKRYGSAMQQALEDSVVSWSGIVDENSEPIQFSREEIKRLPVDVLIEVAQHVLQLSALGAAEKKAS